MGKSWPVLGIILITILSWSRASATTTTTKDIDPGDRVLCTAGVVFLKTFSENNNNDLDITTAPLATSSSISEEEEHDNPPETYILHLSYPCDSSPLPRIEKLKRSVRDPFVSFYLKRSPTEVSPRAKRSLVKKQSSSSNRNHRSSPMEYGSGDYDDDDDEEDEEEDEDEYDKENEIIDHAAGGGFTIEPSNHVIPNLPTPLVDHNNNHHHNHNYHQNVVATPSFIQQLSSHPVLLPQASDNNNDLVQITPTRSYGSQPMFTANNNNKNELTTEMDNDLVLSPNVGSGDGPYVLTTPVYNPSTTEDSSSPSSSSYPTFPSSSSSPTPAMPAYHLLHPIPKQLIYSGVAHNLSIPRNTFQPPCDSYELAQHMEPWVFVQGSSIRFFPTTEHISDYVLTLVCRQNPSAVAELFVSVRQRQKSRLHNHAFKLEFGMIRGNYSKVENLERIVGSINEQVGGSSNSSSDLVVLSTELDSYPFRISYVNESIISNVCPEQELKQIYTSLQQLSGVIKLESVKLIIPPDSNQCDSKIVSSITGDKSSSSVGSGSTGGSTGVTYGENFPPSIKNQIDKLNGSVGEYLVYHVKEDFCYDPEDGGTRNLRVELRTNEMATVPDNYWLQFDAKNQEFYGLPMVEEVKEFVLVCSDRGGKAANDVLELQINGPRTPHAEYNTEFNLHFQSIPFGPKAIRKFMEKLSTILSPHIQVHSFAESNNHVLFKWFNTTNPSTESEVTEIRKVILSDDGPVNKRLYEHFSPEFNVSVASIIPLRGLLSENNPVDGDPNEGGGGRYFDFDENEENNAPGGIANSNNHVPTGGGGGGGGIDNVVLDTYRFATGGYLTTYIIPSVLIAVMILLALIIACLLSRKNKYTQASTEDDSPNSQAYLKNAKKGVPVIFQDELDEKLFGGGNPRGGRDAPGANPNIYEPPASTTPSSQHHQGVPPQGSRAPSAGGFASTPPSTNPPRYHPHAPSSTSGTPQPPDYQNSISRSMRNRSIPPGGVGVLPHVHPSQPYNQIDSYAPPPGINYYGIHNSNSGGFGGGGGGGPSGSMGHHHPHHHPGFGGGGNNPNKMPPPPYVPP